MQLAGRVIVIVGGTGGMGLSAARRFVREGARVVAVGLEPEGCEAARRELGAEARVVAGDATAPDTAHRAIACALESFGGFHGLYHVAGGSGRKFGDGPLHEITDEGWHMTVQLNLTSLFHSNRAAAQQFLRQRTGGSVLNMTSVLAYSPSPTFFATHAYSTAKAAIVGLTRAAASYYAPHDIRFNAVAPALVDTPMARRAMGDEAIQSFIRVKQPLDGGRPGRSDDLDAAAIYFLSDASRFVTGQVLAVDGGWGVSDGRAAPQPHA